MTKWIDLNDASGARLKLASIPVSGEPTLHIFITGLPYTSPKWAKAANTLGFNAPTNRKYLVRRVAPGERLVASLFHSVFPAAKVVPMEPAAYMLKLPSANGSSQEKIKSEAGIELKGVRRLGRNQAGQEVFDSLSGRFFVEGGTRTMESAALQPSAFLRLNSPDRPQLVGQELAVALTQCGLGFVKAMDLGEVQHSEDYIAFRDAVFPSNAPENVDDILASALDAAVLSYVRSSSDVAAEAFSPMARLYDFLPPYVGQSRGLGAMPAPLSVVVQRLLGDTAGKTILYPNAFDGATFAFLPQETTVRAYRSASDKADLADFATTREGVTWLTDYEPPKERGVDGIFFNADPAPGPLGRTDYFDALQNLRSLAPGARAVIALSADGERSMGRLSDESERFLQALGVRYSIEDVFETAPILSRKSGGAAGMRVVSLRNVKPPEEWPARLEEYRTQGVPLLSSWDSVKSHVDEAINKLNIREAESDAIDVERSAANQAYQRPYIAFSKVGEARSMVPANLQASSQAYLTRVEKLYGPVDEFVQAQLGVGIKTLEANFSPEQIDGIATSVSRMLIGRSSILSDDTGLGKGRQLAALATWANKRGESVVFITEKANLFSDLARDLKHIGEWERFRPLVLNADGEITFEETPGAEPIVLAKGTTPAEMQAILSSNASLEQLQSNIVFLTYSQIAMADSTKSVWLKNQLANSLVIADEVHVAAGSASNIATQIEEVTSLAKHVVFSSATWAKSHDNMHIYQRAFPSTVAVGTLAETMRKGGDSFSELFSTMLSAEGALIRREHDLSKLEVEMVIDSDNRTRNEDVSDKVAEVLGAASFISGDMQQMFIRSNTESVSRLRGAREVRDKIVKAKLFTSSFGAGSVIYQVMKGVQGALNAEHVANLAIESAGRGMKPVIVSDATGESLIETLLESYRQENKDAARPDSFRVPTLRDLLRHVIYKRLSTIRVEDVTQLDVAFDDAQNRREERLGDDPESAQDSDEAVVLDSENLVAPELADTPVSAEETVAVEEAFSAPSAPLVLAAADEVDEDRLNAPILADVDTFNKPPKKRKKIYKDVLISDLPDIPGAAAQRYADGLEELEKKIMLVPDMPVIAFDVMAQKLRNAGLTVAEISGRSNYMVQQGDADQWQIIPRAKSKKAVKATIRSFNNGSTDVVIMNRSAASGVSMHSSPRFLDQSRRHLIEHQIPEDPVIRVQLLGRVNRYDQLSTPLITTASTGIYGEVRYLMMQNKKLSRMSANVRSSRDNAMALKGVIDLFNVVGREACVGFLQDNPLICKRVGITEFDIENNPDIVNKLTMRIPLLTVKQQQVVYEEIYSRHDEIMLRAELEGVNPLRPNELDVRASTESEIVFFGDDTPADEFTSAFDAPVYARKIAWQETRNPLSFAALKEVVRVNSERLTASGYLVAGANNVGLVVNPEIVSKVVAGYHGVTRLTHMATDLDSYEEAMTKSPLGRRSYLKYDWMKQNLPLLSPGAKIVSLGGEELNDLSFNDSCPVVVDVKPPADPQDYLDAGKWKISVIRTGDERPTSYTLRSMLTALRGEVAVGAVTGDIRVLHAGNALRDGLNGRPSAVRTIATMYEMTFRGKSNKSATVLTGNMYLAAEWAAATKQGNSAIYTDAAGERQRIILLTKEASGMRPENIPVRVADGDALKRFLLPLTNDNEAIDGVETPDCWTLDTSFKSALHASDGVFSRFDKRDALLGIAPGLEMAITCNAKDAARIKAAISTGQIAIRRALLGPDATAHTDEAHVLVRSHTGNKGVAKLCPQLRSALSQVSLSAAGDMFSLAGRPKASKVAMVSLSIDTPAKAERAIKLLREFNGLEVFAASNPMKAFARRCIQETLVERRERLQVMQTELRQAVLAGSSGDHLVDSSPKADSPEVEQDEFAVESVA